MLQRASRAFLLQSGTPAITRPFANTAVDTMTKTPYHMSNSVFVQRIDESNPEGGILDNIYSFFDTGAKSTGLRLDKLEYIKKADQTLKLCIPLERENGQYEIVTAFRSKHKNYRTPTRGGIRFSPTVNLAEMEALGNQFHFLSNACLGFFGNCVLGSLGSGQRGFVKFQKKFG
jgi:hypothetical protein